MGRGKFIFTLSAKFREQTGADKHDLVAEKSGRQRVWTIVLKNTKKADVRQGAGGAIIIAPAFSVTIAGDFGNFSPDQLGHDPALTCNRVVRRTGNVATHDEVIIGIHLRRAEVGGGLAEQWVGRSKFFGGNVPAVESRNTIHCEHHLAVGANVACKLLVGLRAWTWVTEDDVEQDRPRALGREAIDQLRVQRAIPRRVVWLL